MKKTKENAWLETGANSSNVNFSQHSFPHMQGQRDMGPSGAIFDAMRGHLLELGSQWNFMFSEKAHGHSAIQQGHSMKNTAFLFVWFG